MKNDTERMVRRLAKCASSKMMEGFAPGMSGAGEVRGWCSVCKLFSTCEREVVQEGSPAPVPQTCLNTSDFPFVMVGFDGDSARCGFSI